ncbi:dUMP phosphatase [compost metagenome]
MLRECRAALIDAGETLIETKYSFYELLKKRGGNFSNLQNFINIDDIILRKLQASALKNNYEIWTDDKRIDEELHDFYAEALLSTGAEDINTLAQYLVLEMKKAENWKLINGGAELLETLLNQQMIIGMISNWGVSLPEIIKQHRVLTKIHFHVCSSLVGCSKPSLEIFDIALSRIRQHDHSIYSQDVVMIGDSYICDIEPALSINMKAIWISKKHKDRLPNMLTASCLEQAAEALSK